MVRPKENNATRSSMVRPLLQWYKQCGRHDLPWRRNRDPYHILVSELMLQQTQVSRVIPKYETFLKRFPTVHHLARASRTNILEAWQGLGYNSRALRLHDLAQRVSARGGKFPTEREELLALPGIGPYTAGAIRIFAYDEPDLSVDVNVRRVIARTCFSPKTKMSPQKIDTAALNLIKQSKRPHDWHSAMMDFGAIVCTARPSCQTCSLRAVCKSKGVRIDEKKKAKNVAPFHGSNRWWRGRILRTILAKPTPESALPRVILERSPETHESTAYKTALNSLISENIVERDTGHIVLVERG